MSTAWLFPGQDAFSARCGLAWAEASPAVRRNLLAAEALCGVRLLDPKARRRLDAFDTAVVQPLLTALCLGIAEELRQQSERPDLVAGASLGELPAWAIATDTPAETAVAVAHARGTAMRAAALASPGTMKAVRHSQAEVAALLERPGVALGARNGAEEWVLTGSLEALAATAGRPVPVTGPWHAPSMAPAAAALAEALPAPGVLSVPMVLNDAGRTALDAADLHRHLVRQLTHPADWYATVNALVAAGVTDVVVIGPGRVLRNQLRQLAPHLAIRSTDTPQEVLA